jgi:hypothetical protein
MEMLLHTQSKPLAACSMYHRKRCQLGRKKFAMNVLLYLVAWLYTPKFGKGGGGGGSRVCKQGVLKYRWIVNTKHLPTFGQGGHDVMAYGRTSKMAFNYNILVNHYVISSWHKLSLTCRPHYYFSALITLNDNLLAHSQLFFKSHNEPLSLLNIIVEFIYKIHFKVSSQCGGE